MFQDSRARGCGAYAGRAPALTPAGQQHTALKAIAARGAARKALHFATDEDRATTSGVDPYTNLFDLGDDPLAYYWDRMALAQALLQQVLNRTVLPGEPWTRQLAAVGALMRVAMRGGAYAAKYVVRLLTYPYPYPYPKP